MEIEEKLDLLGLLVIVIELAKLIKPACMYNTSMSMPSVY